MNLKDQMNIAGDLRVGQALCKRAEDHVGDDQLDQALETAEQAVKTLTHGIVVMRKLKESEPTDHARASRFEAWKAQAIKYFNERITRSGYIDIVHSDMEAAFRANKSPVDFIDETFIHGGAP